MTIYLFTSIQICAVYIEALQSPQLCFSNLTFPADDEQKRDQWKKKLLTGGIFCVIGIVLSVIGVPLWIAVGVVVANPPYESKWFSLAVYNLDMNELSIIVKDTMDLMEYWLWQFILFQMYVTQTGTLLVMD